MPKYRLYVLESAAKRFHTLREFEAPGDGLAVALVEDARGREALELWCGNKRVKAWDALSIEQVPPLLVSEDPAPPPRRT